MTPTTLDPIILDSRVEGRNLRPGTLRDQLGLRPSLLVFLRHLGCLFTKEWLAELSDAAANDPALPSTLYFHLGTVEQGDAFFSVQAPDIRAIADPKQKFYNALGVPKAPPFQLLDPRVWACGLRATRGGHKSGMPVGDPFVKPGLFLVENNQVTWKFIPDQLGGLPAVSEIPRLAVV